MTNKASTLLGLLMTALLAWPLLSARAAAKEDERAADEPDKKVAKEAGGEPAKEPAKREPGEVGEKPAKQPPEKKDDLGIPPGDPWLETQAGRTELKTHVLGSPLELADLKGQVLLVAHWDSNREKTRKLLPALVRLDRQYRRRGLIVIGVRRFHRDRGRVISTAGRYGVKFSVYGEALVPDTDFDRFMKLKTPYCYVLDHTGKVIFEGRPSSRMMAAAQSALRKRPHPLIGKGKYPKSAAILAKIRAGKLGEAVALCKKAKEKQGQAAEEAEALLTSLEQNAERLLSKAKKIQKHHPFHCLGTLTKVKKDYAGTPYAEQAEAMLKKLSQDVALQNEIEAEKKCRKLIQALATIPRFPYNAKRPQQNRWINRYGATLRAARSTIARLREKYAATKAFKQAQALYDEAMPEKPEK